MGRGLLTGPLGKESLVAVSLGTTARVIAAHIVPPYHRVENDL